MQAYSEIKRFVQETLGCSCPEEVFNKIDYQKESDGISGSRVNVGDRLLIYIINMEGKSGIQGVINRLLDRGEQGLALGVEAQQMAVLGKELADRDLPGLVGHLMGLGPALLGCPGRLAGAFRSLPVAGDGLAAGSLLAAVGTHRTGRPPAAGRLFRRRLGRALLTPGHDHRPGFLAAGAGPG